MRTFTLFLLVGGASITVRAQFTQYGAGKGAADALEEMIAERQARERAARGEPNTPAFPASTPPAYRGTSKLMLFGDDNHTEYLGCLSCGEFASDSVVNPVGRFGSPVSPTSISNPVSRYGSIASRHSACSIAASNPPVVVDGYGNYYGELTISIARRRINNPHLLGWLEAMCQHR